MTENLRAMEAQAHPLFRAGHIPGIGEWLALPLVALAGSRRVGDVAFDEIFHPIAERLLARCDAVLRVGAASQLRIGGDARTGDESVMVWRLQGSPPLNLAEPLSAEWRPGELW